MKVNSDARDKCTHPTHPENNPPTNSQNPGPAPEKPEEKSRDMAAEAKALEVLRKKGGGSAPASKDSVPISPKKEQMLKDFPPAPHPCTVPHTGPNIPCV